MGFTMPSKVAQGVAHTNLGSSPVSGSLHDMGQILSGRFFGNPDSLAGTCLHQLSKLCRECFVLRVIWLKGYLHYTRIGEVSRSHFCSRPFCSSSGTFLDQELRATVEMHILALVGYLFESTGLCLQFDGPGSAPYSRWCCLTCGDR